LRGARNPEIFTVLSPLPVWLPLYGARRAPSFANRWALSNLPPASPTIFHVWKQMFN
jgi:hypothetical protein